MSFIKLLAIAFGLLLPYAILNPTKGQIHPDIVLNIKASPEFIKGLRGNPMLIAEREIVTGPEALLNKQYVLSFIDNTCKLRINCLSDYVYLRLLLGLQNWPVSFLAVAGDSISLDVQSSTAYTYKSKHQVLAACQMQLSQEILLNKRGPTKAGDEPEFEYLSNRRDTILQNIDQMLSAQKGRLSPFLSKLLGLDYGAQVNNSYLNRLDAMANYGVGYSNVAKEKARKKIAELHQENSVITDPQLIQNSTSYPMYLFELERLWNRNGLYQNIRLNYKGLLREKLLTIYFKNRVSWSDQFPGYLQESLAMVKDPVYHQLLSKLASVHKGSPAYPFKLESQHGKYYALSDFKGKVLVCKFWFLGCGGCRTLHQEMKPLVEKLGSDTNVVFISISVDHTRSRWETGLKDGAYTSDKYLNLFIGSKSTQDPMIEYYSYFGFPQLLLIDRDGRVISANPERPSNPERLAKLEAMILAAEARTPR